MSNIVFSDFAGEICSHFLLFQPKKVEGSGLVHFFEETTKAKNSEIKQPCKEPVSSTNWR